MSFFLKLCSTDVIVSKYVRWLSPRIAGFVVVFSVPTIVDAILPKHVQWKIIEVAKMVGEQTGNWI